MTTAARWRRAIAEACAEPDPARCNRQITRLHYELSNALREALGREAGPNFHSWAVWGSRKAGMTIRQEDLNWAVRGVTVAGAVLGAAAGSGGSVFGLVAGFVAGGWAGWRLALWRRGRSAQLLLAGNRLVLEDIGGRSAQFLELLEAGAGGAEREAFLAELRPGPTEQGGQERLARAFGCYLAAHDADDPEQKHAAMIAGNCEIVYHEHIRLEPYIRGAMPLLLRRMATKRLMTYTIGGKVLTVAEPVPGMEGSTGATNWARIEERMRYVFALFRRMHEEPEVFAAPYAEGDPRSVTP